MAVLGTQLSSFSAMTDLNSSFFQKNMKNLSSPPCASLSYGYDSLMSSTCHPLADYLTEEIMLHPEKREFSAFSLTNLLHTVFTPTAGCKVCILVDFDEPAKQLLVGYSADVEIVLQQKNDVLRLHAPQGAAWKGQPR